MRYVLYQPQLQRRNGLDKVYEVAGEQNDGNSVKYITREPKFVRFLCDLMSIRRAMETRSPSVVLYVKVGQEGIQVQFWPAAHYQGTFQCNPIIPVYI